MHSMTVTYKDELTNVYNSARDFMIDNNLNDSFPQYVELTNNDCYICKLGDKIVIEAEFDDDKQKIILHQALDIDYSNTSRIEVIPVNKNRYMEIYKLLESYADDYWFSKVMLIAERLYGE